MLHGLGIFQGKSGPTKLIHMIMTVARDPTMQPVVIYIDECEQFFVTSKKDKDGCNRFKKVRINPFPLYERG